MKEYLISVAKDDDCEYPSEAYYFSPSIQYPEYVFDEIAQEKNSVYDKVRKCFIYFGLDKENIGKKEWNPLGEYINPGDKVLIKPNWVMDYNPEPRYGNMECLVTNPSVIRAVIDYILIALKGQGSIIVGDAPMYQCNIKRLLENMHYTDLIKFYKNHNIDNISFLDFRNLVAQGTIKNINKTEESRKIVIGDNGIVVNLGNDSCLDEFSEKQIKDFRIFGYSSEIMNSNHLKGMHKFLIHQEVLSANVIINMPKCKTHRKAGVTACAKNFVGINCRKEYLPHHRTGSLQMGGDEYPYSNFFKYIHTKVQEKYSASQQPNRILGIARKFTRGVEMVFTRDKKYDGCWYGNDTLWRTIVDLNNIVEYVDEYGNLHGVPQRKVLNICDLIIAGEGEGPLRPMPKFFGAIICGESVPVVDYFVCRLMGFLPERIKYISYLMKKRKLDMNSIRIAENRERTTSICEFDFQDSWKFVPASGWKGHIER